MDMRRFSILTELYLRTYWPVYLIATAWVLGVQVVIP